MSPSETCLLVYWVATQKFLASPHFKWLENGPIQQFFMDKLQSEFFSSSFDQPEEHLVVVNGMLSVRLPRRFQAQDGTPCARIRRAHV